MKGEIALEFHFFLISIACGILLLMAYDCLRIIRRVIRHAGILVAAEDLLFWIGSSLFIFTVIYKENYGIIRSFSIVGMLIGMLVYRNLVGDYLAEGMAKLLNRIIRIAGRVLGFITLPLRMLISKTGWAAAFFCKKLKKPLKYCIRGLKKKMKTVKIAITKK